MYNMRPFNVCIKLQLSINLNIDQYCSSCSSSDKSVKVWDAGTRTCVHTFFDHQDQVWLLLPESPHSQESCCSCAHLCFTLVLQLQPCSHAALACCSKILQVVCGYLVLNIELVFPRVCADLFQVISIFQAQIKAILNGQSFTRFYLLSLSLVLFLSLTQHVHV